MSTNETETASLVRPQHYSLGELIARLQREDSSRIVPLGFMDPHSYRGYYRDVAFVLARNVRIGDMTADAVSALGSTYQGWKGGDYTMADYTDCWLVEDEGDTGESIGAVLLELLLAAPVSVTPDGVEGE